MKNLKFIFLFLVALSFNSCQDLLNEDPEYTLNNKTVFETEKSANIALLGCYGYLTNYDTYGQTIPELSVNASGFAWSQTNGGGSDLFNSMNTVPTDSQLSTMWGGLYKAIGQCNFFIDAISKSTLSDKYKKNASGQAKFVRGLCYYNLATYFGGVPLRIQPTTAEDLNIPKSSQMDVFKQVEKDWLDAANDLLPKQDPSAKVGMGTKYAAYAYLTKLYFMMASQENTSSSPYWAKAKAAGDEVILNGGYSLEPKFANLFKNYVASSPESIFQLNFTTTSTLVGNRTSWVFSPANSTTGISFARVRSSKSFYDFFKGTYLDDPRLKETFITTWKQIKTNNANVFSYPYTSKTVAGVIVVADSINYATLSDPTNPKLTEIPATVKTLYTAKVGDHQGWPCYKKFMDVAATAQNSNRNIILYRYADFLLIMAEVENELGNTTKSVSYANLVLSRARASKTVPSVFPKNWSATSTQAELRSKIYYERLFELAGECEMYIDVRRRGADYLKLVVDRHNNHEITKTFVANAITVNNTTNFRDRLLPNTTDLIKKNLLFPIPQTEFNSNTSFKPSDQNYGY